MQRVSGAGCWSSGGGTFACYDDISGGTAPYTATGTTTNGWASITRITIQDTGSYYEVVTEGSCTVGTSSGARIGVTAAAGQSLVLGSLFRCTSWSSSIPRSACLSTGHADGGLSGERYGKLAAMRVLPDLLDLVLPVNCVCCGRTGTLWCPACRPASEPEPVVLPSDGCRPAVVAAGEYVGALRSALLAFKERGQRGLAGPLAGYLSDAVDVSCQQWGEPPLLVPVPSSRAAARQRGGDHLLRLAAEVAPQNGLQVLPALRLAGRGRDSAGLSAAQRAANLAHRMQAIAPTIDRPVLIVDDIVTTGATLAEAARALQAAGWQVGGAAVIAATRLRRAEHRRAPSAEHNRPSSAEHSRAPATQHLRLSTGSRPRPNTGTSRRPGAAGTF